MISALFAGWSYQSIEMNEHICINNFYRFIDALLLSMFVINHYIQHSVYTQALQRFRGMISGFEIIRVFALTAFLASKAMQLGAVRIIATNSKATIRCKVVGALFAYTAASGGNRLWGKVTSYQYWMIVTKNIGYMESLLGIPCNLKYNWNTKLRRQQCLEGTFVL